MKFDLFDAIRHMQNNFGPGSEISVHDSDLGVAIRLTIYKKDERTSNQIIVSYREMEDSNVDIMNLRFKRMIQELKEA